MTRHRAFPWNHAFASGASYLRPVKRHSILDPLFQWCEERYALFRARQLWREFEDHAVVSPSVRIGLNARIVSEAPKGSIVIGENTVLRGMIHVQQTGRIEIGEEVYFGDDSILYSSNSIKVGSGTLLAHDVQIFDNATHPLNPKERRTDFRRMLGLTEEPRPPIKNAPVVIGENCWIGTGSVILQGVTIGEGSVIAAGSVVTQSVEPHTLVIGNIARRTLPLQ